MPPQPEPPRPARKRPAAAAAPAKRPAPRFTDSPESIKRPRIISGVPGEASPLARLAHSQPARAQAAHTYAQPGASTATVPRRQQPAHAGVSELPPVSALSAQDRAQLVTALLESMQPKSGGAGAPAHKPVGPPTQHAQPSTPSPQRAHATQQPRQQPHRAHEHVLPDYRGGASAHQFPQQQELAREFDAQLGQQQQQQLQQRYAHAHQGYGQQGQPGGGGMFYNRGDQRSQGERWHVQHPHAQARQDASQGHPHGRAQASSAYGPAPYAQATHMYGAATAPAEHRPHAVLNAAAAAANPASAHRPQLQHAGAEGKHVQPAAPAPAAADQAASGTADRLTQALAAILSQLAPRRDPNADRNPFL